MKNRYLLNLLIIFSTSLFSQEEAVDEQLDEQLLSIGADAAPKYMTPFMQVIGTGLNNGWFKSSKSFTMFGLPFGFNAGSFAFTGGLITDEMRTFNFSGELPLRGIVESAYQGQMPDNPIAKALLEQAFEELPETVEFEKNNVPTIFGSATPESLSVMELLDGDTDAINAINALDPDLANTKVQLPFVGIIPGDFWASIPNINTLTVGIKKVPLINNIQVGVSYIPPFEQTLPGLGDVKFNYLSYKIQHEITPFLPFLKHQKLIHASWFYAANTMDLQVGSVSMDVNSWNAMANASIDFKILKIIGLGVFGGIGYESNGMDVVVDKLAGLPGLPGFTMKVDPKRSPKTSLGARFSLFIFDVWGEYNIGQIQSYTFGITAVAFDGL